MARFFVELTAETTAECVIEAPSREAAERFMEREKAAKFSNWFLDMNDQDYEWYFNETTEHPDVHVNEQGEEFVP